MIFVFKPGSPFFHPLKENPMSSTTPSIKDRLAERLKQAMKSGEKDVLGYARNLHAAIRKKEIDERVNRPEGAPEGLNDDEVLKIISSLVKQRQDSIEQFQKGGREDLVANEQSEMAFLKTFMPAQMGEAEVRKLVDWAVTEAKAQGPKDMGQVMKLLMPKVQGKADGKLVSQLVKERIGS
jgi:uncharacterized protein YqeY